MLESLNFVARAFPLALAAFVAGAGLYFDNSASFAPAREQAAVEDASTPSIEAREVAQWAVATRDHAGDPFLVMDSPHSRIHAYDAQGRLRASASLQTAAGAQPRIPGRFWSECIAALPREPGVAYVVAAQGRETTAATTAMMMGDLDERNTARQGR